LAQANHYKLFILTGQSNSLGTTNSGESDSTSGSNPSDRHRPFFWDNIKDASNTVGYKFVGSISGGYSNSLLTKPDINGQTFENNHDGHFGWRAFWINGRIPLPSNRQGANRGEGTIENWTGQASPQNTPSA